MLIFNPMYKNRLDSAFKDEVNKALQGGFTADELKKASIGMAEATKKTLIRVDRYLVFHQNAISGGGKRSGGFDTDYVERAKALTVYQVHAVLRKYDRRDKMTLMYAGDFK